MNDEELIEIWRQINDRHIAMAVPKMVEYGSADLIEIGRDFLKLADREGVHDDLAYEAGVFMYMRGKMARWFNAVKDGRPVPQDTLDDLIVYATMILLSRKGVL